MCGRRKRFPYTFVKIDACNPGGSDEHGNCGEVLSPKFSLVPMSGCMSKHETRLLNQPTGVAIY